MKIVHVVSALTKGGGERVVAELANIAIAKGDEVSIILSMPVDPTFLQNSIHTNVKLVFLAQSKWAAYLKIAPWIIKNRHWLNDQDVLHCHLTFGAVFGTIAKILLKTVFWLKQLVIVETYHAVGMAIPKFNRWVHSQLILFRDGIVFMAKDNYWNKFIQNHKNVLHEFIPNGIALITPQINDHAKQQIKNELGILSDSQLIVGTIGMLRPDRNPILYVSIFKHIFEVMGHKVNFVLGGAGTELEAINAKIQICNITQYVKLPGLIKNVANTVSCFDIYVSVSVGNVAGISMIEAAMCKIPVVAIQLQKNYVAKSEDWIWSHTDLQKVSERIVYLLENDEERKKLAEKQFQYVSTTLTSDAMYESYNLFYEKLLQKKTNS